METFLVNLFAGFKLAFTLALLLGWLLAWRFKSKGGGYLLWIFYGVCVIIAALIMFLFQDLFGRNDAIREWFMSDTGFISFLNGGRGLRFPAAQSISLINGLQIMGLVYCIVSIFLWKTRLRKKP